MPLETSGFAKLVTAVMVTVVVAALLAFADFEQNLGADDMQMLVSCTLERMVHCSF